MDEQTGLEARIAEMERRFVSRIYTMESNIRAKVDEAKGEILTKLDDVLAALPENPSGSSNK